MKKSFTILFWSIYFLISAQTTYINPDHLYTSPSCTIITDIKVTNVNNLGAFQLYLNFDSQYIQANSSIIGEFLGSTGRTVFTVANEIDNTNGQITLAATTLGNELAGASGEGILFQIEWTTNEEISEIIEIELLINSLQLTQPDGTLIPTEVTNGIITINNDLNTNITSTSACPGSISVPINVNGFLGVNEIYLNLEIPSAGLIYSGFQNINTELSGLEVNQSGNIIEISYNGDLASFGEAVIVELLFESENNNASTSHSLTWNESLSYYSGTSGIIPSSFNNGEIEITPLPSSAESITGNTNICSGEQAVPFSINIIINAENYLWELSPSSAGEVIYNNEEINIDFSNSYIGNATLSVSGENDCGTGDDAEILISIAPHLGNLAAPNGPSEILTNITTSSNYYIDEESIDSFEWILIPSEAGNITANLEECEIIWNSGFVGIVELKVNASNNCNDAQTEALEINIDNNVGQEELLNLTSSSLSITPNPITEESSISYHIKNSDYYTLRLIDLLGRTQVNYFENIELKKGEYDLPFRSNHLNTGSYILILERNKQTLDSQKIIL